MTSFCSCPLLRKVDGDRPAWEKNVDRATLPKDIASILALPAAKRNKGQEQKLVTYHRSQSKPWAALDAEMRTLTVKMRSLVTTTPILREGKPRVTHIQLRGNFKALGERVIKLVKQHAAGRSQHDDITLICFGRKAAL